MLATTGPMPTGPSWAAEVKWDGARSLAYLPGDGSVQLVGRNLTDYTDRFPEIAEALSPVAGPLILDGEIVVMGPSGAPSFNLLQQRVHRSRLAAVRAGAASMPALYIVFDVPHTDRPLTGEPYYERRHRLEELHLDRPRVRAPAAWSTVEDAFTWTREHRLEGLVAKRVDSPYRFGRAAEWRKVKHIQVSDVLIGGWLPGGPHGATVRAVLVGVQLDQGLLFAGSVGTGFDTAERRALAAALRRLDAPVSPFTPASFGLPRGAEVRFVRPELTAEVAYLEVTEAGRLRQPVWRGLRGT
ncbi:ATP-dependent DNA ligase [Kitasatospora kifunensis]